MLPPFFFFKKNLYRPPIHPISGSFFRVAVLQFFTSIASVSAFGFVDSVFTFVCLRNVEKQSLMAFVESQAGHVGKVHGWSTYPPEK